jgi:hypothetical protein
LLNVALKNVITDDQLSPRGMLTLAQAMRDLNTQSIATYTIDSFPKRIGEMSVLIPALKSEEMKNALAIFQGRAPLVVESATLRSGQKQKFELAAFRVALTSTALLSQKIDGVVPPNDPACR